MGTIVGLLFILIPVVFKLIEKKLQQSAATDDFSQAEYVDNEVTDSFHPKEMIWEPKPHEEAKSSIKKSSPFLPEEQQEVKKKKIIDPKDLVIYSEIMKPKYED